MQDNKEDLIHKLKQELELRKYSKLLKNMFIMLSYL